MIDCRQALDDDRFNVDVDWDVGGERRRWAFVLDESGVLNRTEFDEICIGCEIILKINHFLMIYFVFFIFLRHR